MNRPRESQARIDAIRRRDPFVLEAVARENIPPLTRAARAAGLDEDTAHDAVQETLLTFVRRAADFDGRAKVRTWLFAILFRKVADQRRKHAREHAVDDVDAVFAARFNEDGGWARPPRMPDVEAASAEAMERLSECLDRIPERRRTAFVLREVQHLDTDEICNVLQISRNNLGVLLFRARHGLRECLESKGIRGSVDARM